jgi:CDP-diacylglycerol--glycerol-3-phosphate 3-phosphatidyltransferase
VKLIFAISGGVRVNLPNKLTISRLVSLPLLIACFYIDSPLGRWGLLVLFVLASITDYLDGRIARSRNLVTSLGKFLDPIADKALVNSVLVCFVEIGYASAAAVIIILIREFVVSGVRMEAASRGKVVAANIFGKAKTLFQMVSMTVVLFLRAECGDPSWLITTSNILCWISAAITALSGIVYVVDNKEILTEKG